MKFSTMNEDVVIRLKVNELNAIIHGMSLNKPQNLNESQVKLINTVLTQLQCVKELL